MRSASDSPNGCRYIEDGTEHRLVKAHRKVMMSEAKMKLIKRLLAKNLCTNDIYSFICGQADVHQGSRTLDKKTMICAMRSKLRDLSYVLKSSIRENRQLEARLHKDLNVRSYLTRRKIKQIRSNIRKERTTIDRKHELKINHLEKSKKPIIDHKKGRPNATSLPTVQPRYLGEFSTLSIYGAREDLPMEVSPLGPFVTDTNIKLSPGGKNYFKNIRNIALNMNLML